MEKKKYASYAEIEKDLEILKLEKEINYQKLVLSVQKTKESLAPDKMVSNFIGSYTEYFSNNYTKILQRAIPYVIGWFINRKRG
ncbi:DUF6327 family protein [Flavobacterium agrisoli]|uniref:Uncharacterized protein n=1 Tax=Flavobacterium agrisoli TaxID=2793066 RepID=A0A934PK45_9FLAO|nr:DUF6327 family protein [Flavobacterium agrisoli]MBK0369642.1 hypothetical protein [Flavobacterium agrisoli]